MKRRGMLEARSRWRDEMAGKQDTLLQVPGIMGRTSDEAVDVATRPGYIWVRIGSEERLGQALCRTEKRYNLPCILGYDGVTSDFQVLRIRQETYTQAGYERIPDLEAHGPNHSWPMVGDTTTGSDVSYIYWQQIMNFRPSDSSTGDFYVKVEGGYLPRSSGMISIGDQEIDLSGDKPSAGACWVMVYLDEDGDIAKTVGSTVYPAADLAASDMPRPTAEQYEVCQVMLFGTQQEIRYDRLRQDIVDRRFPMAHTSDPWSGGWGSGVVLVAQGGGGQSTTVQGGLDAAASGEIVLVLPGNYAENVSATDKQITFLGSGYALWNIRISGADDVGPAFTALNAASGAFSMRAPCIARVLSGGSGEYILVDASDTDGTFSLVGGWLSIDGYSLSRDIVALKISGDTGNSLPSLVRDSVIIAEDSATSNVAVELAGGEVIFEGCQITGDITCEAASTLILRDCIVEGDVTGMAGSSLRVGRGTRITGAISTWDSVSMIAEAPLVTGPSTGYGHLAVVEDALDTENSYRGILNYHIKAAGATGAGDIMYGFYNWYQMDQAGGTTGSTRAFYNLAYLTAGTVTNLYGISNAVWVDGGTTGDVYGDAYTVTVESGTLTGEVTGVWGYVKIFAGVTAAVGPVHGMYIYVEDQFGVDDSVYLLYLNEGGGVDYAIYHEDAAPSVLGGDLRPFNASGQHLGDSTHSWDLYTMEAYFVGATGTNILQVPDNLADALHLTDAGATEYLKIVSTDAQPEIHFNDGGQDIDFYVEASGVADALVIRGSDGQITLGALGAGYVMSDASGVLSVGAGGAVGGSGAAGQVAYWTDASTIAGDTGLTFNSGTDTLTVGALVIGTGGDINPTDASGQDLGDATHRWDLYTQAVYFGGATGTNILQVPDNLADAIHLVDAGATEYLQIVSTDAQPVVYWNQGEADIDYRICSGGGVTDPTDAFFLEGATGFVGLGTDAPGNSHLVVYDATLTSAAAFIGIYNYHLKTGGTGGSTDEYYATYAYIGLNQSTTIGTMYAAYYESELTAGTASYLAGLRSYATMTGGTASGALGSYANVVVNGGTIGDVYGMYCYADLNAGTVTGNAYALYLRCDDVLGVTGSVIMLYMWEQSGVDYGVWQQGSAPNRFGGTIAAVHNDYWALEDYHAGTVVDTGYVQVTINGSTYRLRARAV